MKKLFIATLFLLALPMLFSPSEPSIVAPFSTVAIAGHAVTGNWCECGCPGCICDPGEEPTLCMNNAVSTKTGSKGVKGNPAPSTQSPESTDFDLGSGALLVALALLMLRRMMF